MTQTLYLENILNRKKNIQLKNLHTLDVLVTDKNPTSRYFKITKDLYQRLNDRLSVSKYLAGEEYTIADIATWPWVARHQWHDIGLSNYPSLCKWYEEISKREAVIKGFDLLKREEKIPKP